MFAAVSAAAAPGCIPVKGDRILGSDLAEASPVFRDVSPGLVVGFAPRPGVRRTLSSAELLRIARENQIETQGMLPVCFERLTVAPSIQGAIAAMRDSLAAPDARVEIVDLSQSPAPEGTLVFPRAGLSDQQGDTAVWKGYVEYDGGRFPLSARVRVASQRPRVVATVNLTPGVPIRPGDVRVDDKFEFPSRAALLSSVEEALGTIPRRFIPAGQRIAASAVKTPPDVSKGETVVVEVHSGAARLKLEATAELTGSRGEFVSVRNASSGKVFRARVEGKGLVRVDLGTSENSK
jgi:flagella basal body P-ring formation protein FlgA